MTTHTDFIFGDEYSKEAYNKLHYVAGDEHILLYGNGNAKNLSLEEIDSLIVWLTGVRQQIDNAQKEGRK